MTVFNKEKKAIKVTRSVISSLFAINGRARDRSEDMAKRLNVTKKSFFSLVEKLWGEKSMPNLSLIKNIQYGSVGFSDETLKKYGWVDAKESGVGLLAFFATLSPEQRKVLEAENRKKRRSLNPITGETELGLRSTANGRELVEWKDLTLTRSALRSIIDSEKKGNWCPCGDKCPSCDIQTSKFWITLRKATEHFVRTGDECDYELTDEDVVAYWCQIAPKLSKEMFQANGANERAVCKTCFDFALKRVADQLGATSISVPR